MQPHPLALQVVKPHKQASAAAPAPRDRQVVAEEAALAAMQRLAVVPADSLHGGLHDMPGSEVRAGPHAACA